VLLPPRKRRSSNSFLSSQWRDMVLNSKKRHINARRTPDERQKGAVELRGKNSPRSDRCCFHFTTIFCSYIGARTMTGSAFLHTYHQSLTAGTPKKHNGYLQPSVCRLSPSDLKYAWPAVVSVLLAYLMWLKSDNAQVL